MSGNTSNTGDGVTTVDLHWDMSLFDALPASLRHMLAYAWGNFSCDGLAEACQRHGEDFVVHHMLQFDEENQRAAATIWGRNYPLLPYRPYGLTKRSHKP